MSKLLSYLYLKFSHYINLISIFILLVIFSFIVYYFYNNVYLNKYFKNSNFKDLANKHQPNEDINLYYISADWCPYCKKANEPWNHFVDQYNNKQVNDRIVHCIKVKDDDPQFTDLNRLYKIEKYPTVFIIYNSTKYDFDSSVTFESLKEFVNFVAYK
jgi:thiol-disulfide isomerase/thioredoxin